MPTQHLDPSVIQHAPLDVETVDGTNAAALSEAYKEIGQLADQLAEAEAEIAKLNAKQTVDSVRAELLKPYTNKVFWFVVWYCVAVGALIILDGFEPIPFQLKESTVGIIAGSTAVSVIGLIGMVVSGLFGGKKH